MTTIVTILFFGIAFLAWLMGMIICTSIILIYIILPFAVFHGEIKINSNNSLITNLKILFFKMRESLQTKELIGYISDFGLRYEEVLKLLFGIFIKSLLILSVLMSVLIFLDKVAPKGTLLFRTNNSSEAK